MISLNFFGVRGCPKMSGCFEAEIKDFEKTPWNYTSWVSCLTRAALTLAISFGYKGSPSLPTQMNLTVLRSSIGIIGKFSILIFGRLRLP